MLPFEGIFLGCARTRNWKAMRSYSVKKLRFRTISGSKVTKSY